MTSAISGRTLLEIRADLESLEADFARMEDLLERMGECPQKKEWADVIALSRAKQTLAMEELKEKEAEYGVDGDL